MHTICRIFSKKIQNPPGPQSRRGNLSDYGLNAYGLRQITLRPYKRLSSVRNDPRRLAFHAAVLKTTGVRTERSVAADLPEPALPVQPGKGYCSL